jgi:hypothetical protein
VLLCTIANASFAAGNSTVAESPPIVLLAGISGDVVINKNQPQDNVVNEQSKISAAYDQRQQQIEEEEDSFDDMYGGGFYGGFGGGFY